MKKKRNNSDAPSSMANILGGGLLKDIKKRVSIDEKAQNKWEEVVGESIASMSRVVMFSRGVLDVEVDSSALLSELDGIYKNELKIAMGEGQNPIVVNHINFKLAGRSR